MTNQEAFTRIVQHLRWQGEQSLDEKGDCLYRSPSGLRCAVGVLITDEFYHPKLENNTADSLADVLDKALPGVSVKLLQACQEVHDSIPPSHWENSWHMVAELFKLQVPPLDEPSVPAIEETMELVCT